MNFKIIAALTTFMAGFASAQQPPVGKAAPPGPPAAAESPAKQTIPATQAPILPPASNTQNVLPPVPDRPLSSQTNTQLIPRANILPPSRAVENLPPPPVLSPQVPSDGDPEFPSPSSSAEDGSRRSPKNDAKKFKKSSTTAKRTGSDTAVVEIPEHKGSDAVPPGQELVNIDFPEPTEIKDIVRAVALWMNKNVILDRNVSGKIQIISPKRVTKEEAYQAFLSALNVLQFTTVEMAAEY